MLLVKDGRIYCIDNIMADSKLALGKSIEHDLILNSIETFTCLSTSRRLPIVRTLSKSRGSGCVDPI